MFCISDFNIVNKDVNEAKREVVKILIDIKNIFKNECDFYINILIGDKEKKNIRYHIQLMYRNVKFEIPLNMISKKEIAESFLDEEQKNDIKWLTRNMVAISDENQNQK